MKRYEIIFTCKGVLSVFKETVEASDTEEAKRIVKQLIRDAGLTLIHITAIIEV